MANEKGPKDVEKIKGGESTSIKDGLANTLKQPNPELFGNRDAILKDLKENHVKVEENVWYMGQYGKKVHINLPAVGKFRRFKFDYFVSNKQVTKREFEIDKLEEKSYSVKDVGRLLGAMNRYMQAMGVETDGDLDYENALKLWERGSQGGCNAGDCLMEITGLHRNRWLSTYWLNDRKLDRRRHHLRAKWCCYDGMCNFQLGGEYGDGDVAYLFFRCR